VYKAHILSGIRKPSSINKRTHYLSSLNTSLEEIFNPRLIMLRRKDQVFILMKPLFGHT